jgi:hypothetical protein
LAARPVLQGVFCAGSEPDRCFNGAFRASFVKTAVPVRQNLWLKGDVAKIVVKLTEYRKQESVGHDVRARDSQLRKQLLHSLPGRTNKNASGKYFVR